MTSIQFETISCHHRDAAGDGDDGPATWAEQFFEHISPLLPDLRRYLVRRVPAAELEDLIQDVLLRICRRGDVGAIAHPKSYLYQAAHAAIVDRHRRDASRYTAFHCELTDAHHPVDELSPLRILLAREEICATEAALRALPERTREILIAMRVEGWSLKSLAARYDISTGAIEKHVTRGVRAVSAHLASVECGMARPAVSELCA